MTLILSGRTPTGHCPFLYWLSSSFCYKFIHLNLLYFNQKTEACGCIKAFTGIIHLQIMTILNPFHTLIAIFSDIAEKILYNNNQSVK